MSDSGVASLEIETAMPGVPSPPSRTASLEPDLQLKTLDQSMSEVGRRRGFLGLASVVVHVVLVALVVVVPILLDVSLPEPESTGVRAFLVQTAPLAPPPPPPPPAAVKVAQRPKATEVVPPDDFVAPLETPQDLPESAIDLGIEGGIDGGVEGGVPGGVVGGVVGGLPEATPPPAAAPVRVGGKVKEPTRIKDVPPVYPDMAARARIEGTVILECLISPQGRVTEVKVLRGVPVLDAPAVEAARQWVYTPTLLDGIPVPVIMTVTVRFELRRP